MQNRHSLCGQNRCKNLSAFLSKDIFCKGGCGWRDDGGAESPAARHRAFDCRWRFDILLSFDAKYRIWTKGSDGHEIDASPRAAIDDMHRYRDAILYRLQKTEIKHEIIGVYVLYPGRPEPHLCKEYDESIRRENIGAIPLLPGHLGQ